ncbi:MAG: hypothetical protein PWP07_2172 [Epulopiscium sp.]|jgi:hypothetical protein|nr:hypothetical protein [Defluviitaleaceae bacterium]MDK2788927.1 hypothetical protein [Candidatus Epulonipiscium sp.]HHW67205.1 DUF4349 domain-containing protein [Candidatus Epulonipiscium sp.]
MSCEQFREAMSPYIDGLLEDDKKVLFEDHLKSCPDCNEEFEQFKVIMNEIHHLPQMELPDYYHQELLLKLYQKSEEKKQHRKGFSQNWKVFSTLAAGFIVLMFVLGNLVNMGMDSKDFATQSAMPNAGSAEIYNTEVSEEPEAKSLALTEESALVNEVARNRDEFLSKENSQSLMMAEKNTIDQRKIIYESFMSIEVDEFDDTIDRIKEMTNQSGGYVENSSSYIYYSEPERDIYLKQGTIKIRIPVEQYGQIQGQISNLGHLIHQEETSTNVTEEYIETESRIRMLEVEQERLLDIMKQAEKVEDLIKLEEHLNEVRTDLEIYKSKIKNWDQLVSFSTFTIEIREVREVEHIKSPDPNFKTKIQSSFIRSLNDLREGFERLAVALAYGIIPFILFICFLGILFLLGRPLLKKILIKVKNWREK